MPPLGIPLAHSKFSLNTAGVAGFFGGEEAISAMHTVHLYEGRRWLGWFNSPGSYTIAKCFGRMANSRFWDGLFPGSNDSPAESFGLDGKKGPEYIAALSGTKMHASGHLAYLVMERSKDIDVEKIEGRVTKPCDVSYLAMKHVTYSAVERLPFREALLGLIPISCSVTTCVMCALVYDWLSFAMILLGIISSGLASVVIGKGRLVIDSVKEPAAGAPPGHGILMGEDGVVVIKGEERDVNAITKGRFVLETDWKGDGAGNKQGEGNKPGEKGKVRGDQEDRRHNEGDEQGIRGNTRDDEEIAQVDAGHGRDGDGKKPDNKGSKRGRGKKRVDKKHSYHEIGISSLVLLVQFLLQLLLIPQGTLFGQIMFLVSLSISWGYNSYLSSLEKEKIQAEILFKKLGDPKMLVFRAGTRTTMAVFLCLLLFHGVKRSSTEEDRKRRIKILNECLPNDTDIWIRWRQKVVEQLIVVDADSDESLPYLVENEEGLLKTLLGDARAAFEVYFRIRHRLPVDSSENS